MYGQSYKNKLETWNGERKTLIELRNSGKTYGEIASLMGEGWNYDRVANRFRVMKRRGEYENPKGDIIYSDVSNTDARNVLI